MNTNHKITTSEVPPFHHTRRLLRIHRYIVGLVSVVVVIGASVSAIRIGNAPVLGPVVVFAVMGIFFGVMYAMNKHIERGLFRGDLRAWISAFFWALLMCIFVIGIPATRELLSSDVRQQFFRRTSDTNRR